jgi:hypothetical protein
MKNQPPPLKVGTPCPKQWNEMDGGAKRRFCEHCQLHVHNLSAMSERERRDFTAKTGGQGCISYLVRPDGTMISERFWSRFFRPLRFAGTAVLATLLPFWFSACARERERILGALPSPKTAPGTTPEPQRMLGVPAPPDVKP